MGLFDGSDPKSDEGSTMALARLVGWPIVVVVRASKAGRSLAVGLRGFVEEAGPNRIAGFILNGVSGDSHTAYLREAIAPLRLPVLGAIPFRPELDWQERHLGLQASQERDLPCLEEFAAIAELYLDVNSLLEVAVTQGQDAMSGRGTAVLAEAVRQKPIRYPFRREQILSTRKPLRIGIAKDEAFHFYYQANLDYLVSGGAELVEFSPLHDAALPTELDLVFLGGGFPELFAEELAQNNSMRRAIRSAIDDGLNCYAECGGLMVLVQELVTLDGSVYPMCGVIPGAVEMTKSLKHFGYCICSDEDVRDKETVFHGHEFHHSVWSAESEYANLWRVQRKRSGQARREGFKCENLHASYVHLHFHSSSAVIEPFLTRIRSEAV
jgi:cobyrinic acid a,c-diamide synthase